MGLCAQVRVLGFGFGVWALKSGVGGLGFGVGGLGCGVWGVVLKVWGLGFGVWGSGVGGLILRLGVRGAFRGLKVLWCLGFKIRWVRVLRLRVRGSGLEFRV